MAGYIGNRAVGLNVTTGDILGDVGVGGDIDVDGTANLDVVDVDGAANFAADVTFADGADIITASAGTSNFRAGVNAGNSIASGGNNNVCVGDEAGTALSTGDESVFVGFAAGDAITTGTQNVAVGSNALGAGITATNNVAVGRSSMAGTLGSENVAVGVNTLATNQGGSHSVAIGSSALVVQNPSSGNVDFHNTAVGSQAGKAVTTGVQNTLIGALCGDNLTTGSLCTKVGYNMQESAVGIDNEIMIGTNITGAGANTIRLGTAAGNATLNFDGSDTSWAAASDSRLKKEVVNSTVGLNFIKDLRSVTFKWNAKNAIENSLPQYDSTSSEPVFGEGKAHHGFIAQEVKTVIDNHSDVVNGHNLWGEDPDGTQQISQGALVPMLVKAIQELSAKNDALEARIATLEG